MECMRRLLHMLAWVAAALVAAVALAYVCEDLVLRYRVGHGGSANVFDHVTVYEAGAVKGGKLEYYFDRPQVRECVRAMFPHFGDPPCWYARRHSLKILSRTGGAGPAARAAANAQRRQGDRSSKLEVIWIAARSDRYTGHFGANMPWTRSMVSRFSSGAAITNATWIRRITSTPSSASISPFVVHDARPSSGEIPRAASAPAKVPSIQPPVAATT
jgi:hypothetical protein